MARSRRRSQPAAGQQPLFTPPDLAQPAPPVAPASQPDSEPAQDATVYDLPGAALGDGQVQLLPLNPPVPPVASPQPRPSQPLRYGRWRLDGPLWELRAALAALRRDTLTGRDLRRHLAELDGHPPARPQGRPQARPIGGEAGSARG